MVYLFHLINEDCWNSNTLATSCEELTHWKRLWCWEGLGAGGEGDDRGWDAWMASPTRWTWVWVNSRSWWWTGRPGVLEFMGSQRVGHNWATELNWTKVRQRGRVAFWRSQHSHKTRIIRTVPDICPRLFFLFYYDCPFSHSFFFSPLLEKHLMISTTDLRSLSKEGTFKHILKE